MEKSERETVIVANLTDIAQGFIRVFSTERGLIARLIKRAGATILRQTHADGRISGTDLRVPWSRVGRGLLALKAAAAPQSVEVKQAARARLAAMRKAKTVIAAIFVCVSLTNCQLPDSKRQEIACSWLAERALNPKIKVPQRGYIEMVKTFDEVCWAKKTTRM